MGLWGKVKRVGKAALTGGASEIVRAKKQSDRAGREAALGVKEEHQANLRREIASGRARQADERASAERERLANENAPPPPPTAEEMGTKASEKYGELATTSQAQSDAAFAPVLEQFQASHGRVDEMLGLQKDAAINAQSEAARRGTEMGALQGASGFGGMQAGKNLQAQMFGQEMTNKAYQNALEQHLGLDKGLINAKIGKITEDSRRTTGLLEKAIGTEYEGALRDQQSNLDRERLNLNVIGSIDWSLFTPEERSRMMRELGLEP